jgi:hypothetical protein
MGYDGRRRTYHGHVDAPLFRLSFCGNTSFNPTSSDESTH